jgi:hypothetical protein
MLEATSSCQWKAFQTINKIEVRIGCEDGAVVSERDGCYGEIGQW